MFVRVNQTLIDTRRIIKIDLTKIEELIVEVTIDGTLRPYTQVVEGIPAIDLLMAIKPSVLESRRLWWARRAWAFHNLVGHPTMQLLAFCGQYKLAMWVHDMTVPRPLGKKE